MEVIELSSKSFIDASRLGKYYGCNLSQIRYLHGVNNTARLSRGISGADIVEMDVRFEGGELVLKHDVDGESTLTLQGAVDEMSGKKVGIKLDIKEDKAVEPIFKLIIEAINKRQLVDLVILNADVFSGPGASPENTGLSIDCFVSLATEIFPVKKFPQILLSVGGITKLDENDKPIKDEQYFQKDFEQILQIIEEVGWKGGVTIPIRAAYLVQSGKEILAFLKKYKDDSRITLNLWNNEPVTKKTIEWIIKNLDPNVYFNDLIDSVTQDPLVVENL